MLQLPRWRVMVVLAATLLAILFSVPNVIPQSALSTLLTQTKAMTYTSTDV